MEHDTRIVLVGMIVAKGSIWQSDTDSAIVRELVAMMYVFEIDSDYIRRLNRSAE